MLECASYPIDAISAILKTKGKQATDRKLESWGVKFTSSGRGKNCVYEIQAIENPLRVFFMLELHIPSQADWRIARDVYYYFYCVDNFEELSYTQMEEYLIQKKIHIDRHIISQYIRLLDKEHYISRSIHECACYIIRKTNDEKVYVPIERKQYGECWKIFWNALEEGFSHDEAHFIMRKKVRGVPYKHLNIEHNAFTMEKVNMMLELIADSYLNETDHPVSQEILSHILTSEGLTPLFLGKSPT